MRFLPPSLLWAAFAAACVASAGSPAAFLQPRWDAEHYVSIAARGYELHACPPEVAASGIAICGNLWFPGWSYWNKLLSFVLPSWLPIQLVFSFNAALFFLILLCMMFLRGERLMKTPRKKLGWWGCAALVCQPASFYYLTQFPYSFCLVAGFAFILLYKRKAPVAAAIGAWASLAYPTSVLFSIYPLLDYRRRRQDWAKAVFWLAVFCSGTALVCLIFQVQFDDPWLYFHNQAQYHHGWRNPLAVIMDLLRSGRPDERLAFAWYALGFLTISLRLKNAASEPSFLFFAAVLLFSPLSGAWLCVYRHYLMCLPLGVLLGAADVPDLGKAAYLLLGLYLQFSHFLPRYLGDHLI